MTGPTSEPPPDRTGRRDRASWRLRTYPAAVLAALAVVILVVVATSAGSSTLTGRLGGDLPEFYGAGRIVADGDAARLYDPDRQLEAQADLFAGEEGGGVLFAYPALLAAPYAALTSLGYRGAYLVHLAVMVALSVVAARLLSNRLYVLRGRAWISLGLAVSFTFLPMFIGVANGQITALVLLGLVAVWVGLADGRDGAAGFFAGLLLIKPQYGGLVLLLLLAQRRWRPLAWSGVGVAVVWLGSAAVAGLGWTTRWLDLATSLSDIDQGANLENEVSWLGLAELAFGRGSGTAMVIGVLASGTTAAVLLWRLRGRRVADPMVAALVPPALLLVAPHSLYYDAGLLLVSLAALIPTVPVRWRTPVVCVWWFAGFSHSLAGTMGAEPVAALVLITGAWALWASRLDPAKHDLGQPELVLGHR